MELVYLMERWREEIFTCKFIIGQICSEELIKDRLNQQLNQYNKYKRNLYIITHNVTPLNTTDVQTLVNNIIQFMANMETQQEDLCPTTKKLLRSNNNNDTMSHYEFNCRRCLEVKADDYYTNGQWCKTYREWHLIRYLPKIVLSCP